MMGRQDEPERLFYEFRLESHVPRDHLPRRIDAVFDFSATRKSLEPYYSSTGRPSIDPELMIRMLLIGYCFGIRSERRLAEHAAGEALGHAEHSCWTRSTQTRRRAGLTSFPTPPLSGSAFPASDRTPPCEAARSPPQDPSDA